MIFAGFRFGLLLQIAVGPICLYIFQSSVNHGFRTSFSGVLGVTLIDTIYILAAILGLGKLIENNDRLSHYLKFYGFLIITLFGINIILGSFGYSFIPSFDINTKLRLESTFIKSILLTLANPLTILFWAGVFTSKLTNEDFSKKDIYLFAVGAISSTLIFLTFISITGSFTGNFINNSINKLLNIVVGIILISFSIKNLKTKKKQTT